MFVSGLSLNKSMMIEKEDYRNYAGIKQTVLISF